MKCSFCEQEAIVTGDVELCALHLTKFAVTYFAKIKLKVPEDDLVDFTETVFGLLQTILKDKKVKTLPIINNDLN